MTTTTQDLERIAAANAGDDENGGIHSRAVLVSLTVGLWTARRFDRKVTDEVNEERAASKDAGRYNKHLFANNAPTHKAAVRAGRDLRTIHYDNTLAWADDGWRLLPSANFMQYTEALREARGRFDRAVEAFVADYPRLIDVARDELNGLWRADDYPSPENVRGRFYSTIEYSPVPNRGDFRLDLPADHVAEIERTVTDRVRRATDEAMRDAWYRLHDDVARIYARARPKAEGAARAVIRDSLIESARQTAEILGRLNVTGDASLEAMRLRVLSELEGIEAQDIRDSREVAGDVADRVAGMLDAMAPFYGDGADAAYRQFHGED